MKPIIGITGCTVNPLLPQLDKGTEAQQKEYKLLVENSPSMAAMYSFNQKVQMVFENDVRAIENAGGVPLIIPATEKLENIEVLLNVLDGILLTGGYDINPKHYQEEDQHSKGMMGSIDHLSDDEAGLFAKFSETRDLAELALVRKASAIGLPIMGICRGCQVINVAMGGRIYQDILAQGASENNHSFIEKWNVVAHDIQIEKDSHLYRAIGMEVFGVNSIHHQSIKEVGTGLRVVGRAEDGIVECIESDSNKFILGVQWHPEMMHDNEDQQKILSYFIDQCKSVI